MLTENDIARIARRIAEMCAPLVVGTFGSYATGNARDWSDLDLFVIKETSENPAARARGVQRSLFGVLHPFDRHVYIIGLKTRKIWYPLCCRGVPECARLPMIRVRTRKAMSTPRNRNIVS